MKLEIREKGYASVFFFDNSYVIINNVSFNSDMKGSIIKKENHMNKRYINTIIVVIVMVFLSNSIAIGKPANLEVTFFDVGAGDCNYIKLPNGKDVLIDGGTPSKGYDVVGQLIRQKTNNTVDYVISTHPDYDHFGGLQNVFKRFNVKNFYYPKDVKYDDTQTSRYVMSLAKKEKGCKIMDATPGAKIAGGKASIEFVQSSKDYSGSNEDSVMCYVDYGNFEMLLTGDAERGAEALAKGYNVDVVQAPHHGSQYSSSMEFIEKFDPEYVVISTDGKKYGHPHKATLQRYKDYDSKIKIFRTDQKGNIKIRANSNNWRFVS